MTVSRGVINYMNPMNPTARMDEESYKKLLYYSENYLFPIFLSLDEREYLLNSIEIFPKNKYLLEPNIHYQQSANGKKDIGE